MYCDVPNVTNKHQGCYIQRLKVKPHKKDRLTSLHVLTICAVGTLSDIFCTNWLAESVNAKPGSICIGPPEPGSSLIQSVMAWSRGVRHGSTVGQTRRARMSSASADVALLSEPNSGSSEVNSCIIPQYLDQIPAPSVQSRWSPKPLWTRNNTAKHKLRGYLS